VEKRRENARSLARTLVLLALLIVVPIRALADHDSRERRRDDDRYVFATTRSLSHMDMHPVMKVILMPGAVILDVVLFPLAALADVAS
jgi:hypothetical protein